MPLLHRRPFVPAAPPTDLGEEEQVFHIEATGEVFRSYEAFLRQKELYGQAVWACRYSGKGGMTFEEAQQAERKAVAALASFPADLEEQVCRAVHHSMARVEELVGSIYDSLRPAAAGEAAASGSGGAAGAEAQAEQPSPFGSKENKPQQRAEGAAEKPGDAEHAADADSDGAAAGGAGGAEPSTAKKADGDGASGGQQRSGRKAKTPKAPVSRSLLRTYIVENAEQQGPEHATKLVWVVKNELRQRFGLPAELPVELEEKLNASVKPPKKPKRQLDAPKGLGTKLPAKKEGAGKKAAAGPASPGGGSKPADGGKEKVEVPMVRLEAKSLEDVERQYKEGTVKAAMVAVLKAAQPEALTVQGIIDKGREMGLSALEDKQKTVGQALSSDPNFLRLSKGAYSLHCLHPDKEQLVRAPPPKEAKKAAEGETPAAGDREREEVPMVRVEAKSLEEVERQYKEGTLKHDLVAVLKAAQPVALTVQGIVDKGKEMGLAVLEERQKGIAHALSSDPNFLRLSKGAYSLHCLHPDKEQLVRAPPPKEAKMAAAEGGDATTPAVSKKLREEVPMVRVEAKSLEEVERQYKEGTVKAAMVAVLKAAQPEALTVQGIIDKGKEMGLSALEDKQKTVGQALSSDPNFLRLSKGAYSLHCLHPDKEQLVRAPPPKEAKMAAAEGETPAAGDREREEVPMVRVEAKSLEEVEKQYKEGSIKHMLVAVLKAAQPEALTTQGILDKAKELGLEALIEKKQAISQAMASDPNFLRLSKGAYSLHCFHPEKEQLVRAPQPKKRKLDELEGEEGEQGSKAAKVDGAGAGEEVDSITKAEQQVKLTQRLLARHRADLEKAQATYNAAKAAWEEDKRKAKKSTPSKERVSDIHVPAEKMAEFEVPEEEREFKGAPDDRKGMLEFRQKLQARMKELAKAKKVFLDAERAKRAKELLEGNKESKAAEHAFRRAERALEHERRAAESAERAAAAAEKKLEKEKERAAKEEERAKERAEREMQRVIEREERERRRAEVAKAKEEAKRYPMEDLELLQELRQRAAEAGEEAPAEDVAQPSWQSTEESQRLSTSLYVADLVSQFSKQLGCKVLHYDQLEAALADATSGGGDTEADFNAATLHNLYERLIRFILEDLLEEEEASAQEKRWAMLLSAGTWPEVLRRLVLTRAAEADGEGLPSLRPDPQALMGASMLAFDCVDSLTHDQLLALLRYLADLALDSEQMRGILQRRADEAEGAKRDVREELAEQRKALKELLDSEKEERKRKREERRKAEEEEKAAAEAAAAAAAAVAEDEAAKQQQQQQDGQQPMDVDAQVEPSFELPERLREYSGPPGDKKALVQWRQEQQAEKRRLEKERNRWMADQLRRQRELEAQEKAAREAEKAKQREKEEKEEAIMRAQEALEERLEKSATRRAPLGADRRHRRYWWGLAGHRAALWVEDPEGRWGSISSPAELDALLASLDRRGVRELALAEAIEKRFQSIVVAMQRAERAAAAGGDKRDRGGKADRARAEPPRRSGRQTQQVDFFDPASQSKAGKGASGLAALMGPAEVVAVEEAVQQMQELQKDAGSLVAAPEAAGSWKEWSAALKAAAGGSPQGAAKPSAAAVRAELRSSLLQLEEALLAQSVGGLAADGEPSVSEEAGSEGVGERREGGEGGASPAARSREQSAEVLDVVDDLFSPTKRPSVTHLWKTQRERTAWQTDLKQAATAARIAYCAAVLAQQAGPMLSTLSKNAFSGGKKGGSKGAKAAERGSGSGKGSAAAAASSRPVSRTSSAAALEAAGAGSSGSKAGKRKAAAPPPENVRVTRSRR